MNGQQDVHQLFVSRVLEVDAAGKLFALLGTEGFEPSSAYCANDVLRRIETLDWNAAALGELADRTVLFVIPPLCFPINRLCQSVEIEFATIETIDLGLIPGLELLHAKRKRAAGFREGFQNVELDGVVPRDGVRLADVNDTGIPQVLCHRSLGCLVAGIQIEPVIVGGERHGRGENQGKEKTDHPAKLYPRSPGN